GDRAGWPHRRRQPAGRGHLLAVFVPARDAGADRGQLADLGAQLRRMIPEPSRSGGTEKTRRSASEGGPAPPERAGAPRRGAPPEGGAGRGGSGPFDGAPTRLNSRDEVAV